ncbi:CaiB/BaiF CoA transferase family protein [Sphingopyxis terrae]|uniref:CaiB/BaiF CoA transferase family protein n=1 Tax=Sphingopyxis terrae TaxID=33052 RepID=UPI003F80D2EB
MYELLRGTRIVDLTTIVLGPYATQLLADFGAEVIKVEAPGGDLFRTARPGPEGLDGAGFLGCNRNKKSIELDLNDADDRTVFDALLASADVLVHNMRPEKARNLGLSYEAAEAVRPGIVYCSARGYGAGPMGDEPAYDDCIQAASGVAWLNRDASGTPQYLPTILCDKVAGLHLALAVASGVASRLATGKGVAIELPMYEAMAAFLLVEQLGGAAFDPPLGPTGYDRLSSPNRRPYATSDGHVTIMPYTLAHWQRFLRLIGADALADDPVVTDPRQRSAGIDGLYALIAEAAPSRTTAEWLAALRAEEIPCAPVRSIDDLLDDPQMLAGGMYAWHDDPRLGRLRSVRSPFRVTGRAWHEDTPAPGLDADGPALRVAPARTLSPSRVGAGA